MDIRVRIAEDGEIDKAMRRVTMAHTELIDAIAQLEKVACNTSVYLEQMPKNEAANGAIVDGEDIKR